MTRRIPTARVTRPRISFYRTPTWSKPTTARPPFTTPPRSLHAAMTPLQYAVRTAIDSSTFSFRSPAVAEEVWTSIQAAPDSVCEEFLIVGEHVLRTCFLSLMLKREVAHPDGFLTVAILPISEKSRRWLNTFADCERCGPLARRLRCACYEGRASLAGPDSTSCNRCILDFRCCFAHFAG